MNNFIEIKDLNLNQIANIFDLSSRLKKDRKGLTKGTKDFNQYLLNKVVALLFKKPSTRTRFSFEVGIFQMGGKTISVSSNELQISNLEAMSDTAGVLTKYLDMIVLRTDNHSDLTDLIKYSDIPIINGLSDQSHPCQVLSDLFTYEEISGSIKDKKVVWLGDLNNVCNSYIQASDKFNFKLIICGPLEFIPKDNGDQKFEYEVDPKKALKDADLIVTDTWYSMNQTEKERQIRKKKMQNYTLTNELLKISKNESLVFHCMPIYRNNEITSDIVDKFFDIFLKQAENRLHVQKGIMNWCFS
mgnify:FL=1